MPEIENNQAVDGADNTGAENESVDNSTDTGNEAADTSVAEGSADKAKAPEVGAQDNEDDGSEPPVTKRLTKQDYIIGRQKSKIAKKQANDNGEDDVDNADDSDIAPADAELIGRVVADRFAPIIDKSLADDANREVNEFLTKNPDFKPFEAKARRYMAHPSRQQLPIDAIFYEVAGSSLIKIGAERERAASDKAKGTQTGGGSNRSNAVKPVLEMTAEEFTAEQARVRRGE